MKRKVMLGISVVLALVACLWLVRNQGAFNGSDPVQFAETEARSAEAKLSVVTKTADMARKVATIIPDRYPTESRKVLISLQDTEAQAHLDSIRAQKKLNWAKVEAGDAVRIASYTNYTNDTAWSQTVRALVVKGIAVKYEFTGDLGVSIWVRKEDVPLARECLALPTDHEVGPSPK